ncbi:MAG TPA: tetratricopeptide repeat protein [Pyrinomonadaceae bacterium]
MRKPSITTTVKPLPFGDLSPSEFERLCLWLIEREGYKRPQHLGDAGGEQGRDITAYKQTDAGEELWYFQCKRYRRIDAPTLKREIDKYNKLSASDPTKRPVCVIFITSASVSAKVRDTVMAYCREHGYQYDFWTSAELDMYVNKYPEIVDKFFSARHPTPIPALHQLEPPPGDFMGRTSELSELVTAFDERRANVCLLHGMGGVGKTALALKLAEHLVGHYPDAQIYLNLKGTSQEPLSVTEVMRYVLRSFRPSAELPENDEDLAGCYRSVLHSQKALLFLDNAADRWQVEPLVPPTGCALLITSRQGFHLPGMFPKRLDGLSPDDARKLLLAIAPRIGGMADVIAGLCGHLPLALRSAARMLVERVDISVAEYMRRLTDVRQRLEPVSGAISLSYELINQDLQRLWHYLAVFPDLFDVGAAASVCGLETDAAQDALGEMLRYSLLEWNEPALRYRLHDLMRLFASERLIESERKEAHRRHAEHYINVLRMANILFGQSADHRWVGIALFDTEWPNIQTGQSWAANNTSEDEAAASLCSHYPDAGAHLLHLRVHPTECIRWREAALAAAHRLNNRTEEAFHLGNLGMDYAAVGQTRRAIELHGLALEISREIGDRHSEANDLRNLAMCYASLGEPDRAVELLEQSLSVSREIGDRHGEALVLGNLGIVCSGVGEFRRAINYYEEALPLIRDTGDLMNEGNLLSSLAGLYALLGEVQRAVELHQKALSISRQVGDLRGIAQSLGNLGWVLAYCGDNERGFEYHQQQLIAARELGDRRCEADALHGIGIIYSKAGQKQHAVECFEQALAIFRETGNRPEEERALGDFGSVYLRAEEFHSAIECYEQQLVIAREIHDRRGEAAAIWNTGWAHSLLGNYTEAMRKGVEAIKLFEGIEDFNQVKKIRDYLDQWSSFTGIENEPHQDN